MDRKTLNLWATVFVCGMLAMGSLAAQDGPSATSPQSVPAAGNDESRSWASGARAETLPAAPSPVQPAPQRPEQKNGTSNDRLFWTLPNFLTVENANKIPPLTAKQKFNVVLRSTFDPVEYPYVGFLAGISQAADSEPGYGQGAAGYAKRYGSAFADTTIENFMTGAILPSLLHQDPRYYQLGRGSFKHRTGYAISRIFVTRGDSGHDQFNASEILGSGISAAIGTNTYHPAEDRTAANTISVWWTQVGWDTVAIAVKEFWPDIRRRVRKRHEVSSEPVAVNPQTASGK